MLPPPDDDIRVRTHRDLDSDVESVHPSEGGAASSMLLPASRLSKYKKRKGG